MSGIVCAIRGGPASRPTIERSIQLAADTGLTLIFLYVVNLDFLSLTASSRTHLISKEMEAMGEFILLNAQTRAEAQGIATEAAIRHGQVGDEIIKLCKEINANYVILGRPKEQDKENVFTHDRLSTFTQHIESESGAKIILAA
ncbi:MAG: universal stress protein [Anaerolineales bacterium]|jgi:nucleotide-binding universal stress UspA family protein